MDGGWSCDKWNGGGRDSTKIGSRLTAAAVVMVVVVTEPWEPWEPGISGTFGGGGDGGSGGDGGGGLLEYLSWTPTSLKVSFALALTRVLGVIIVAFVCGISYPVRKIRNARIRPFPRKGRLGMDSKVPRCFVEDKNRVRAMI